MLIITFLLNSIFLQENKYQFSIYFIELPKKVQGRFCFGLKLANTILVVLIKYQLFIVK